MLSAFSTDLPRTRSATSRPFWAESLTPRSFAVVFMPLSSRLGRRWRRACLLVGRRRRGRRRPGLRVPLENPGMREFAELVADHVLGDVHRDMLLAVVHRDRESHEVR